MSLYLIYSFSPFSPQIYINLLECCRHCFKSQGTQRWVKCSPPPWGSRSTEKEILYMKSNGLVKWIVTIICIVIHQTLLDGLINSLNIHIVWVDTECHGIKQLGPETSERREQFTGERGFCQLMTFSVEEKHFSHIV